MTVTTAAASLADSPAERVADGPVADGPVDASPKRTRDPVAARTEQAVASSSPPVVSRFLRSVGPVAPTDPVPGRVPMPRTSPGRPWDRVRFAATHAARTDDGASDLAEVVPLAPIVPSEDPASWCGSLVRAVVETLAGSRPAAQLARWLSADLYEALARRAGLAVRINGRPSQVRQAVVRRVHVCRLSPTVAEAAVVVHDGERVRGAAVRIEAHRGRWRATALEIA